MDAWSGDLDGLKDRAKAEKVLYADAVARGDFDTAAVIVGEGVDLTTRSEPAADILHRMATNAERLLTSASTFIVDGSSLGASTQVAARRDPAG